jgi:hypothetical protein
LFIDIKTSNNITFIPLLSFSEIRLMMEHVGTPETFSFPFPPYPIQLEFMKAVYEVIGHGKVGILESPTGTVSYVRKKQYAGKKHCFTLLSRESH